MSCLPPWSSWPDWSLQARSMDIWRMGRAWAWPFCGYGRHLERKLNTAFFLYQLTFHLFQLIFYFTLSWGSLLAIGNIAFARWFSLRQADPMIGFPKEYARLWFTSLAGVFMVNGALADRVLELLQCRKTHRLGRVPGIHLGEVSNSHSLG